MIKGTTNVWRFRSCGELSTWIRYTSDGDSGSTNVFRESGIRVNGGSGPDSDRGVDASDDAFDAIVFVLPARRADFAMLSVCPSLCLSLVFLVVVVIRFSRSLSWFSCLFLSGVWILVPKIVKIAL